MFCRDKCFHFILLNSTCSLCSSGSSYASVRILYSHRVMVEFNFGSKLFGAPLSSGLLWKERGRGTMGARVCILYKIPFQFMWECPSSPPLLNEEYDYRYLVLLPFLLQKRHNSHWSLFLVYVYLVVVSEQASKNCGFFIVYSNIG